MIKLMLLIILWTFVHLLATDANSCGKLIRCTIEKCFPTAKTTETIRSLNATEMFSAIIDQFSFVCIATKCRDPCITCERCNYALNQISRIVRGLKTEMICPKMETCLKKCFQEDAFRIGLCVRRQCKTHCFDDECSHCIYIAKRVFLRFCRENNIPNLPNVKFGGNCMDLINHIFKELVANRIS